MKRLTIIIFIVITIALVFLFLSKDSATEKEGTITRAKTVIPVSEESEKPDNLEEQLVQEDTISLVSLIPLLPNETLLNTLSIDFDGDGYDDQINAIKKDNSPYIVILIGLYNPFRSQYDRTMEVVTEIMQTRTFSITSMDITGNHKNSLIYTGFTEDGNSVMKVYMPKKINNEFSLATIADFQANGSIIIQQLDRYDSYESQQDTGVSYPIWVYSSVASANNDTFDQLQTKYTWNPAQQKYTKTSETKVTETRVLAKELSRIQDGTVETFANHLEGLWYKTSNTGNETRYMFFNPKEKEIIFQTNSTQEVFSWDASTLRRNGMYISAVNETITNLNRRIDVSLVDVDEIKVRNQDDVRMIISESNLWDGQYKRQNSRNVLQQAKKTVPIVAVLEEQEIWTIDGGGEIKFDQGTYSIEDQTGRLALTNCGEQSILQLRGTSLPPFFDQGSYIATLEETKETKAVILQPVKLSPLEVTILNKPSIRLEPKKTES